MADLSFSEIFRDRRMVSCICAKSGFNILVDVNAAYNLLAEIGTVGSEVHLLGTFTLNSRYLVSGCPTVIGMYRCPQGFLSWAYLGILRISTGSDEGFSKFATNLYPYENKNSIGHPKDADQFPSRVPLVRFGLQFLCGYESNQSEPATRRIDFRIPESLTWVKDGLLNVFPELGTGNPAYFIDTDLFRKVVHIEGTNENIVFAMTRQVLGN